MLTRFLAWLIGASVSRIDVIDTTRPLLVVVHGGDDEAIEEFGRVLGEHVDSLVVLRADGAELQLLRLR